jgi:hypothetical protein
MSEERLRRWRLVLGSEEADGTGVALDDADLAVDRALGALYDPGGRKAGLGASAPSVARWLGDIRDLFPAPVVRVLQRDALSRLDLRKLLVEPELLEAVVPDVHLVAALVSLAGVMPARAREAARRVVRRVTEALVARLEQPMRQAVTGSLCAARAPAARAPAISTGSAPSAPTSSTTSRRGRRSCPSCASATAAGATRCAT